jgi:RNA polymerase sigma factor (sigma-70 family)
VNVGDEVFAARFALLHATAYRVAYRIPGVREDAEDVASEALARAYSRWSRLVADPEPWVVRVAGNAALDVARRPVTARSHAPTAPPAAAVDGLHERRLDLQAALLRLPRRQREVVVLRYLADRTESETASLIGLSVGSVKSHASRALAGLRSVLNEPSRSL